MSRQTLAKRFRGAVVREKMKNSDKLIEACRHIHHELRMMNFTAEHFEKQNHLDIKSALLESFLIHCRNLIDFFYPTDFCKKDKDNILAEHYVEAWPNNISDGLNNYRKMVNKKLAHLSYSRIEGTEWPIAELQNIINGLMREFIQKAPTDKLSYELRGYHFSPPTKSIATGFTTSNPIITIIKSREG